VGCVEDLSLGQRWDATTFAQEVTRRAMALANLNIRRVNREHLPPSQYTRSRTVLGVVLNKADMDRLSSYYPIGENHYRNKYYAQYGITK
jgi:hypothetical protein